jgi:hypothetical protein
MVLSHINEWSGFQLTRMEKARCLSLVLQDMIEENEPDVSRDTKRNALVAG